MSLILASASPRRAELLRAAGMAFRVHPAEVDESVRPGESPETYVVRVAEAKARSVAAALSDRPVLAADTAVVVDEQILGKPRDAEDAANMLRLLSGRRHHVLTGLALVCAGHDARVAGAGVLETALSRTTVEVAALSNDEIAWYVASGEPMDKAGAYAIQGLASRFITAIEGSYTNVVGLPVALVHQMLARATKLR